MDIKIEKLTKKYGSHRAVDQISFEVHQGEILGFLGPNGAGKTTTMKIITNYLNPDEGEVFIGGKKLSEHADELKRHIGYLPENNPLYHDMPVVDYLEFCAALQGIERLRIPERVREMIRITGLNAEKHKKIGELSKGYRQRVGLAQAMIHNPSILILDEPTTGLDPNQIVEIRRLIRELGREKTVILSTHILPEVEATCDRILIINDGKIVADGTAEHLRKQAQGQEILTVKIEDGDVNAIFKALQSLSTVATVDFMDRSLSRFEVQSRPGCTSRREIFNLCVQNHWTLTEMAVSEAKLEDIFRELTMN
ncbi:MAG TPA: ATP-binding cassette domain-containing protein [Bacteroidales bacterium]|nr:ATP-binding cassette domain-containing protein [Bacteroidales bacterium]HOK97628.1 ATP-binding cassette domain-containing protein [Bacteroidales bacterium]HPO64778.1 ATP-binding cassette domain-containing protein [Bacteroidales bacterium]